MNLNDLIDQHRKQKTIDHFKNKYPEVYEYFNSLKFMGMFANGFDYIDIAATTRVGSSMCTKYVKVLPFYDSQGKVDIEDVIEYLSSEDLNAKIVLCGCDVSLHIELNK